MGVYLSSPIRDKVSEDGESPHLRHGASCMQGWRTSQEDAHNCCPDFDPDTNTSLFACYDGHGGAEVAQYTAQHFPAFLKELDSYKAGNLSQALEEAFLGFDATLKGEAVIQILKELAGVDCEGDESEGNQEESKTLCEEATMPLEELLSRYGRGGASAANTLKRDNTFQSPAIRAKKENGDEGAKGDHAGVGNAGSDQEKDTVRMKLENELMNGHSDNENNENIERATSQSRAPPHQATSSSQANEAQAKEEKDSCTGQQANDGHVDGSSCVDSTTSDDKEAVNKIKCEDSSNSEQPEPSAAASSSDGGDTRSRGEGEAEAATDHSKPSDSSSNGMDSERPSSTTSRPEDGEEPGSSSSYGTTAGGAGSSSGSSSSGSSSAVQSTAPESSSSSSVGAGGSGSGGSNEDSGPCSSSKQEPEAGSSSGRTRSKRKNVIPEEGEDESSFDEDSSDDEEDDDDDEEGAEPWASGSDNSSDEDLVPGADEGEEEDDDDEEEEEDDVMGGGEEPGSDSGCTSVVALLRGRELFVANAGDSRCVLCRGGKAMDMSIDHKPEDEVEHSRITKAGGRVTMDGRVNGGLNLSRAIGDHCYKRNAAMSDREQMITALPDIRSTVLEERDEFMVLACDGIWNVMTSQDVVNFVSERLKGGMTKLSSICEEMFEYCLSPDTSGDGTGCDNMTCIIIQFSQDGLNAASASAKRPAEPELPESTDSTDLPDAKKARTESQPS